MKWLRRIAAAPLLVLAFITGVGAVRLFTKDLAGEPGEWVITAIIAAVSAGGAFLLLRPDLRALRAVPLSRLKERAFVNPLGQAAVLYAAAAPIMLVGRSFQILPAVLALCLYSGLSAWTTALQRRWWAYAALAVLGWILLFFALAATSEALTPRGFGESAMLFLLPAQAFPILLVVSGIMRLKRKSDASEPAPPGL